MAKNSVTLKGGGLDERVRHGVGLYSVEDLCMLRYSLYTEIVPTFLLVFMVASENSIISSPENERVGLVERRGRSALAEHC